MAAYLLFLLASRLLPAMVLSVPLFVLATKLGLSGTYTAVIAAHLTFSIPFTVWMMRSFFLAIPRSLDEAATLDGCGEFGVFFRVVLPLTKGGIAATSVFCLINSWNEFLFALVLTGRDTATLPVAVPPCSLRSAPSGARSLLWGRSPCSRSPSLPSSSRNTSSPA